MPAIPSWLHRLEGNDAHHTLRGRHTCTMTLPYFSRLLKLMYFTRYQYVLIVYSDVFYGPFTPNMNCIPLSMSSSSSQLQAVLLETGRLNACQHRRRYEARTLLPWKQQQ
jgi:hypothetical protein